MIYYSATNNGFYTAEIHGHNIPSDAIAITAETHASLLAAQSSGKTITADANGHPIAIEPPPPPAPTAEEIRANLSAAVQLMMDQTVQEKHYDNIQTACTYLNSTNPQYAAESKACITWRDRIWAEYYNLLDKTPALTEEELLAALPKLQWPEIVETIEIQQVEETESDKPDLCYPGDEGYF